MGKDLARLKIKQLYFNKTQIRVLHRQNLAALSKIKGQFCCSAWYHFQFCCIFLEVTYLTQLTQSMDTKYIQQYYHLYPSTKLLIFRQALSNSMHSLTSTKHAFSGQTQILNTTSINDCGFPCLQAIASNIEIRMLGGYYIILLHVYIKKN